MIRHLSREELLRLKRWNTPTVFKGWEPITRHDRTKGCMNLEETRDFMPHMGSMIATARASSGRTHEQVLSELNQAVEDFARSTAERRGRKGDL